MKSKDMKKILASLGVAGLISAGGFAAPGVHAASGWTAVPGAGSTENVEQAASGSGGDGDKESAVSTLEAEKEKTEAVSSELNIEKEPEEKAEKTEKGGSGWAGK